MTEQKTPAAEVIARSVEKVSDSKGLAAIGHGLGWGIAALAIALMFVGLFVSTNWREAANKWDGHLFPPEKCFELRELQGKVYRLNVCTGETQEVSSSLSSPVSASKPGTVVQPKPEPAPQPMPMEKPLSKVR